MTDRGVTGWLLLLHSLPPKPPYLRAKVMRRLTQLGALALKRSAYLLPATDSAVEDFQWLRQEIRNDGGEAWIVQARFVAGLADDEVREQFRSLREAEFRALAAEARGLLERMSQLPDMPGEPPLETERRRLRRRLDAVRRVDFFHADARDEVETLMATIERRSESAKGRAQAPARDELRARTWVTRTGVKVDRMASAWLIRRFIDPAASFAFVAPDTAVTANAVRFDMFDGEFTHDGSRCTFEVLLDATSRPSDPALVALAQIVHDIDLRDEKYQRAETAGVAALIDGLVARVVDDHRRLAESAPLFDALYASFGGETTTETGA